MSKSDGKPHPAIRITYSPNVFVPLSTACTQSCSYCLFRGVATAQSVIRPDALLSILDRGQNAGCTEALFTHGQDPDQYDVVLALLEDWGFSDMASYLMWGCEQALARGLIPHVNPGVIDKEEMRRLKGVAGSMGLMLETTAQVPAHRCSPSKAPAVRAEMIERAGELRIPFTTGLLVGIGESRADRVQALRVIRDLQRKLGHIQEVILQPVIPANAVAGLRRPTLATMLRIVQLARQVLPDGIAIQVPGNLFTTEELIALLQVGVSDLGGISPITPDYINPDHPWPPIHQLREGLRGTGMQLVERLPVYQRYLSTKWCTEAVLETALRKARALCTAQR